MDDPVPPAPPAPLPPLPLPPQSPVPPPQRYVEPTMGTPGNGLGVAAFVASIVGVCTFGVLSPIGLILGIVALRRWPRGFAIAAVVISAIGTSWLLVGVLFGVLAHRQATTAMTAAVATEGRAVTNTTANTLLDEIAEIDDDAKASAVVAGRLDGFGTPLRFERADGAHQIHSAGPDRVFGTPDDITVKRELQLEHGPR